MVSLLAWWSVFSESYCRRVPCPRELVSFRRMPLAAPFSCRASKARTVHYNRAHAYLPSLCSHNLHHTGSGTGVLAVVRSGTLHLSDWFSVGAAAGRVRAILAPQDVGVGIIESAIGDDNSSASPLQDSREVKASRGRGKSIGKNTSVELREAKPGAAVMVAVAWDDKKGGGGFSVGEALVVLPRAAACALAQYRREVQRFVSSVVKTDEEVPRKSGEERQREAEVDDQYEYEDDVQDEEIHHLRRNADASRARRVDHQKHRASEAMSPGTSARAVLQAASTSQAEAPDPVGVAPPKPVAVALRAQSAGELQALLDFLRPRVFERDDERRAILVSCGVGAPREDDLELLRQARRLGCAPSLYTLNVRLDSRIQKKLKSVQVSSCCKNPAREPVRGADGLDLHRPFLPPLDRYLTAPIMSSTSYLKTCFAQRDFLSLRES